MWNTKISYLNLTLLLIVVVCFGVLCYNPFSHNFEPILTKYQQPLLKLPKNPFEQIQEAYDAIGTNALFLNYIPPSLHLPDLRKELQYLGRNRRPDLRGKKALLTQISLKGSQEVYTVYPDEPIFLIYHSSNNRPTSLPAGSGPIWDAEIGYTPLNGYTFSPNNRPTSLWFEITPSNHEGDFVQVTVGMRDESGLPVKDPIENHHFLLKAEPAQKIVRHNRWEIDGMRVDASLLVRQKAKWVGPDLFFEMHGGSEYADYVRKQRVDFQKEEGIYSVFVEVNDFLIWKDGKWRVPQENDCTPNFPLLVVTKVDEKMMQFDLWDVEGTNKTQLTLLKSQISEHLPNLSKELRFVGAKTWAQFMVETPAGRVLMKANDWFLLSEQKWEKLNTIEAIDAYVEQRLRGPLFILDRMVKHEGKQMLVGHLFNTNRTEVVPVELPTSQGFGESLGIRGVLKGEEDRCLFPPFNPSGESQISSIGKRIAKDIGELLDE